VVAAAVVAAARHVCGKRGAIEEKRPPFNGERFQFSLTSQSVDELVRVKNLNLEYRAE